MSKIVEPPQDRMKTLLNNGNMVNVDPCIPIRRYYRSGTEMLRMANIYLSEGNLENAFILFMRYMSLFIEQIRRHPSYESIKPEVKQVNKKIKEDILPKTEKLRSKILAIYIREYEQFIAERQLSNEKGSHKTENTTGIIGGSNDFPNAPNLYVQLEPRMEPLAPSKDMLSDILYPVGIFQDEKEFGGAHLPHHDRQSDDAHKGKLVPPTFDRNAKPKYPLLEGVLRQVRIPSNAMNSFLKLAEKNTLSDIETCGILAGQLCQNQFYITHIIVPHQRGNANSCDTLNEEDIFDVQDNLALITLGWIHTHPTQTAFLSSVDLHTHCAYQIMLPEAIAIVCAPKMNTYKFFVLTPEYGLNYIAQCKETGFHPHPNQPSLFMEAQHVYNDNTKKINVIDLRR